VTRQTSGDECTRNAGLFDDFSRQTSAQGKRGVDVTEHSVCVFVCVCVDITEHSVCVDITEHNVC
jgi:hypothetical protein